MIRRQNIELDVTCNENSYSNPPCRIKCNIESRLTEYQFGFRKGKETILALRQEMEKRLRKGKTTCINLVDLEKAFYNATWNKLFGILRTAGVACRELTSIYTFNKHGASIVIVRCGNQKKKEQILRKE